MSVNYDNPQAAPNPSHAGGAVSFNTGARLSSESPAAHRFDAATPSPDHATPHRQPAASTPVRLTAAAGTGIRELVRTPADTTALKNWCDRVAIKWRLTSDQLGDLKQLVEQGAALNIGHLRIALWNQTTLYHLLNKVDAQTIEYDGFKATMDEVQKQVAAAWAPSKAEHTTIRVITRDMLVSPTRTAYMLLARDVMDHLRTNQAKLGLESAFTTPAREECLAAVVRKKASNARTTLRAFLILSIAGKCSKPLEDAAFDILTKLRKGGVGSASDAKADYQIVIALLRRWTFEDHWQGAPAMQEYMKLLQCDEDDDCEPGAAADQPLVAEEESEDESTSGPPSKKRRYTDAESQVMRATVGKVAKGEDFFSKMDVRWKVSLDLWGLNWKESDAWKAHINETIKLDRLFFGRSTSRVLPSLPMVPCPGTPAVMPAAVPLINRSSNTGPSSQLFTSTSDGQPGTDSLPGLATGNLFTVSSIQPAVEASSFGHGNAGLRMDNGSTHRDTDGIWGSE